MYCLHYFALLAVTLNNTIMESFKFQDKPSGQDLMSRLSFLLISTEVLANMISDYRLDSDWCKEAECMLIDQMLAVYGYDSKALFTVLYNNKEQWEKMSNDGIMDKFESQLKKILK